MMARRTKALAIASWAFSSIMETSVRPPAQATEEMHFTGSMVVMRSNFTLSG